MCSSSGDRNASNGIRSTSCQCRISAKRRNRLTVSNRAVCSSSSTMLLGVRPRDHARRILRIDQHDVGADLLQPHDAAMQQRAVRLRPDRRAAANWCRPARARDRASRRSRRCSKRASMSVAVSPLTPRLSTVNVVVDELARQLGGEPARIGVVRLARAGAGGRGRADRDDLDRLAGGELARGAAQRQIEAGVVLRDHARAARAGVAAGAATTADDPASAICAPAG